MEGRSQADGREGNCGLASSVGFRPGFGDVFSALGSRVHLPSPRSSLATACRGTDGAGGSELRDSVG